ncbi:MAG: peptide ABC transporter substrate-binding protein [Gammaproteobacteria bacterium]|nr:peptide ABC transporter substrate-binding protein [Gammaproteobacteria bacterium]
MNVRLGRLRWARYLPWLHATFALLLLLRALPAQAGGILRTGHPGEPDSLDPHTSVAAPALIVQNDLFESLLTLDARGRPVPGAAHRYTVSADGRLYTFILRQDLMYSDGRPITAADFVWSIRRLADPATASTSLAGWIDLLENGRAILRGESSPNTLGVDAPDERTVRIRLNAAAPWFPSIAAFPVFAPLPRHVIERYGRAWTRPENMVVNGPFLLESWTPGQAVRVRKNPRFHAAASVRLDGVEYLSVSDQNTGVRLFLDGRLDAVTNFPPEKLDDLRRTRPNELRLAPSLGVTTYVFNHRLPKFRDPRVREALSIAVDRRMLTSKIVRAGDQPALGVVAPSISALPQSGSLRDKAQLDRARALLHAAGYTSARPLEVELLYHTSEEHKKVAVAIAAMWQAAGVRVTLRNAERQVVEAATRQGDFEIVRAAWFSPYPDASGFFAYLRKGSPSNGGAYENLQFEDTLERTASTVDLAERRRLQRRAEDILQRDHAVIPLYHIVSRRLVAQRVVGWQNDSLSAIRPARWLDLRPSSTGK